MKKNWIFVKEQVSISWALAFRILFEQYIKQKRQAKQILIKVKKKIICSTITKTVGPAENMQFMELEYKSCKGL